MSRSVSAPSSVTNTSPCWNGLIVPGSTFRYGSNFCAETERPRALSSRPSEAATMPFPSAETTPPVTNTYLATGSHRSRPAGRLALRSGANRAGPSGGVGTVSLQWRQRWRRAPVPPKLRRLLEARDDGCCRCAGCPNRRYLDAHHRRHWADGGETTLENLVLLCSHHHSLVHEGGYTIEDDGEGALRFRNGS